MKSSGRIVGRKPWGVNELLHVLLMGFILCHFSPLYAAHEIDVDQEYRAIQDNFNKLRQKVGPYQARLFESKGPRNRMALNFQERGLRKEYLSLKKSLRFWHQVHEFKEALVGCYQQFNPQVAASELTEVHREAGQLALKLIQETERLQRVYGIHNFPIIHNLLIDVRIKKRGACKHWAEDLLKAIDGVVHPHFVAYWGEAHPGNILEHNTAVIVPRHAPFAEGVIFDPWRTAGKPFWRIAKEDYNPWQPWQGYSPR